MSKHTPIGDLSRAIRAFNRIASVRFDAMNEACNADAEFDAGEFSAEHWSNEYERLNNHLIRYVAERFNTTAGALYDAINASDAHEHYRFLESLDNAIGK